jgi:DNA repair protein RadD
MAVAGAPVVFAVNVAHSLHLRDEFVKSGVRAEQLDGSTPTEVRDAILKRLALGETEVVCNCMVLTEGWDCSRCGSHDVRCQVHDLRSDRSRFAD